MVNKAILNREFSTREKVLLLILAVLILFLLYYYLVIKGTSDTIAANQEEYDDLQVKIAAQTALLERRSNMDAELKTLGDLDDAPYIASYNNFRAEFDELNDTLSSATSFDINFDSPVKSGNTVRRSVRVTFTASSYSEAYGLVEALRDSSFKCLINDFSLTTRTNSSGSSGGISGAVNMTIYETTVGATDLSGLNKE